MHDREYHAHHANALTSEWDAVSQWFDDNGIHEFNRDNAFAYCDEVIGSHIIVKGMTKKRKRLNFRYDKKFPDYFSVVGAP